ISWSPHAVRRPAAERASVRIAIFATCVGDALFPGASIAAVEILERLGHSVTFPAEQTCCGQMHSNSGYEREAVDLLRHFVAAFADEAFDAVVAASGSCVAMVKDQYPRLAARSGAPELIAAVAALEPRVYELSQFLVERLGVDDVGAYYPHRVTYHPTCHSLRLLHVGDAPLRLLRRVRGIQLIELSEAESCCGFGGTFAIKNAEVSEAMLADKCGTVLDSGAEVCTALDSSCLMQIGGGLTRRRAGVRVVHLAEILASTEPA
ncbi:MAG TPA: (Fe-S)-binding protein, partial [Solirubrobacteraceae bacterium]|nr:(Fe-S)-binding protein [Solirubrobacteraceae bacterium]